VGKDIGSTGAAGKLPVPVKDPAKPLFFLRFECGKTHRVTVHRILTHLIVAFIA
jgi:hypothetical protein